MPVKDYAIVSSQASSKQREIIDKINRRGGMGRELAKFWIFGCFFVAALPVVVISTQWPPLRLAAVMIVPLAFILVRFHRTLELLVKYPWYTNSDTRIIELDREWRSFIDSLPPGEFRDAVDQARFYSLRRIAELPSDIVDPAIKDSRDRLESYKRKQGDDTITS